MAEASLNGTFGAFLIGIIASSCLFGVTCTQTWYYYTRYSDGIVLKALPCHLLLCHTPLWGSAALAEGTWSVSLNVSITALIALLVYLYYARRIFHCCCNSFCSNYNLLIYSMQCRTTVYLSWLSSSFPLSVAWSPSRNQHVLHLKYFALFDRSTMASLIRASLTLYVVTDLLVAVLLSYFLHSSRTGMKRTDTLINRLIVYAVHNGLITSVADIFVLAFNIAYPKNLVYLSIYQIVANLYSNSFLATLNARRPTKPVNDNFSTNVNTLNLSTFGASGRSLADTARAGSINKRHVDVNITTTVEIMGDTDRNSSTDPGSKVKLLMRI
ncbi:hypothetical protein EV421DRAFT_2015389 [Armillaria borealis]|uniref:DUF6534 domain-containing protein n=1 Tax=Armillaria borealis TaxID=47425 RepID=A0AA39K389_9AGAR|nr:hypothetical protein EV421DRAFT_2015389 [Armillaria borealis]